MGLVDMITLVNNNTSRTLVVTQATDSPSHREDLRGQVQVKVKYLYAHIIRGRGFRRECIYFIDEIYRSEHS